MSTYTWPTSGKAFYLEGITISQRHNHRMSTSPLNGAIQTISLPGMRWGASLDFPKQTYAERAELEGWLSRLSGMEHRLALWDISRPVPRGNCNVSGVTASAASQFATSLTLNGCGASTTLKSGDWFKVPTATGAQLLQAAADATANGSGVATVEVRAMLRGAVSGGAAVTLDKPTALYILAQPEFGVPRGGAGICPPFSLELIEVFA